MSEWSDLTLNANAHVVTLLGRDPLETLRPLKRLRLLADDGSLQVIRCEVASEAVGAEARPGDCVIGGSLRIAGRLVFCFAQDAGIAGGSVGAQHADTIVRIQRLARRAGAPVIGFVESGVAAGGGSYSPALTDFVIMTGAARMFLTGAVTGEAITARELGGPGVHRRNGVCDFTVATDIDAIFIVRQLLGYLPSSAGERPPPAGALEPAGPDPGAAVPLDSGRVYDVRTAIEGIVDADSLLEAAPRWARNLVTALARIDGRPVGIVASQPRHLGGVIDAEASQKGARFVRMCDAFGLPLVVLVDTPGFLPGSGQEAAGAIRHGAGLLRAFAAARVPRITVVLRKAFGGAYITMNSKAIGADLYLAWTRAQVGIMGAEQAVGVLHRRVLAAANDPAHERRRLAEAYAGEHLSAHAAARIGAVDEVIRPPETRARLTWALAALAEDRGS
jgi:acetyl-CoA carboxylase carboxyltransferase component